MLHKLTAWMLALLITSPMCWCGWMHSPQAAAAASKPSCCHEKRAEDKKQSSPNNQSDCPCSQTPKVRDLAASKVTVPAAPLPGDWLITWDFVDPSLLHPAASLQPRLEFHAQGPPLRTVPLFVRHCALLI